MCAGIIWSQFVAATTTTTTQAAKIHNKMDDYIDRNRQIVGLAAGYWYLQHIEVLNRLAEVRRQEDEELEAARAMRAEKRANGPWTRNWLLKRKDFGWYDQLMVELENEDPKEYTNMMRMEPAVFQEMTNILAPRLQRKDTNYRAALPAGKLTLIFLY